MEEEEEMETAVPPSVRKRKMEDELMEDQLEEEEDVIRACVIGAASMLTDPSTGRTRTSGMIGLNLTEKCLPCNLCGS